MPEISAKTVNGIEGLGLGNPTPPKTPEFKRNYFINTADTTGAEPPAEKKKKLGRKEKEAEKPKPPERLFNFSDQTRQEVATFLDEFVTNKHHKLWERDGQDVLKAQPLAREMVELLGGTKKELDPKALAINIDKMLNTPQGWVQAKALLEQEIAETLFMEGLKFAAALSKKTTNPKDLISADTKGRIRKLGGRTGFSKNELTLPGLGIGMATGYFGTKLVEAGAIGAVGRAAMDVAQFLARNTPTDKAAVIGVVGGAAGVAIGRFLGGEPRQPRESKDNSAFVVAQEALMSIKNDPDYARYIKETKGIDVNDFIIEEGSQTIRVIDYPKSTNSLSAQLDGVLSNIETRNHYYDDLGIPPADRDIMPEQFILKGKAAGYERNGERVNSDILKRYWELGGDKDRWGQGPDHPDYRKKGPDEEATLDNFLKDEQGRGPEDPYYFSEVEGKNIDDLPPYDSNNLRVAEDSAGFRKKEGRRDLAGQRPVLPDGTANPFYGRADGYNVPVRQADGSVANVDVISGIIRGPDVANVRFLPSTVDKFGHPEGDPLFGKKNDTDPFDLNNIDDRHKQDVWGQRPINRDGNQNIFFGVIDTSTLPRLPGFSIENFHLDDLIDKQGRKFGDPLFGRGETPKSRKEKRDLMKLPTGETKVRNATGKTPLDAEFWADGPVPPFDPSLFNVTTGLDGRDRPPWHPLFCRDIAQKTPAITDLSRDRWGQHHSESTFGIRPEEELSDLEAEKNLELYRKARELVMADLTEDLIDKIGGGHTGRNVTVINEKITARQGDNGRIIKERREKEAKNAPELKALLEGSITPRVDAIDAYQEAQKELEEASAALPKYISETFGEEIDVKVALKRLKDARTGTGTIRITVDREEKRIESIAEQKRNARNQQDEAYRALYPDHPKEEGESTESYNARIRELQNTPLEAFNARMVDIRAEEALLLAAQGEIERLQTVIKDKESDLAPKGEVAAERHTAIYTRSADREKAWKLVDNDEIRTMLLNSPQNEVVARINELHDADPDFGWEEAENVDFMRDQVLVYAMVTAKALASDGDAIRGFRADVDNINTLTQSTTFGEIESLSVEKLKELVGDALTEEQIATAKDDVIKFANEMTKATKTLQEDLSLKIRRLERDAEKINLDDEIEELILVRDVMTRQGNIFGLTAEVISDVTRRFPEIENRAMRLNELEVKDLAAFTDAEVNLDTDAKPVPVAYYEILNILFDYQNKSDREARFQKISKFLDPETLGVFLNEVAVQPVEGEDLNEISFSLQDNIKKGLLTRRGLRKMLEGIIDIMEKAAISAA